MRALLRWLLVCVLTGFFFLLLLEGLYRFQWLDLYRKELLSFNPPAVLAAPDKPTVLTMGDSFTAGNQSYLASLRRSMPGVRWINGGISGSGVKEALLTASRRFAEFKPRVLVYQIYVGNNLVDLGYRPDWGRHSAARNLWWTMSRIFPSIPYVRRRIQEARVEQAHTPAAAHEGAAKSSDAVGIDASETFTPAAYNERVKLYYQLDPTVTDDSIRLRGVRGGDLRELVGLAKKLVAFCRPPACQAVFFVVPHKAQVSGQYLNWERELGATLPESSIAVEEDYPFLSELRTSLAADGVKVLSPLRELRAQEKIRHVYYVNDDHLNAFGQEKLGDWLRKELAPVISTAQGTP